MDIRPATIVDEAPVAALWHACELVAPYNDPAADFRFALGRANSDVLVARGEGGALVGTAMVGHDGHRGWIYYLAVTPGVRRCGIGRSMVGAAERWLAERGVLKAQLMIRESNMGVAAFYRRLGYEDMPRLLMAKWLE